MKKILHVISSPRGNASHSIKLGNSIVEKIMEAYPESILKETDLVETEFPHLRQKHLTAFFTPSDLRTTEDRQAIKYSEEAIAELIDADIIVVGAPMYNYNVHSSLKAWIDHITRNGHTFRYDENGVEGLIKDKKVYVALTSGFVYTEGPLKSMDFVTPYLTSMLGFLGMTDITFFRIEGTVDISLEESAIKKGLDSIAIE